MSERSYSPKKYRRARALKGRLLWYLGIVGIACAAGGLFYGLFLSAFATKFSYVIEGTDSISPDDFNAFAPRILGMRLPRNILFLSERQTEEYLKQSHAELASVAVVRDISGHRVMIRATERSRDTIWCDREYCYWIDDKGMAFDRAAPAIGQLIVAISDPNGPLVKIGGRVAPVGDLQIIKEFAELLKKNGFTRESITLEQPEFREVVFALSGGTKVRINLKNSSQALFEEFFKLASEKDLSKIEYFDLTVENRIYFKKR